MKRDGRLISIGLPVYNGEAYLEEAIVSILSQSFENFELVISDNASTDHTYDICKEYESQDRRIRYYRNDRNLGGARNYNRVFELTTGKYFKWATHDDVLGPMFLERCVAILERRPDVSLCFPSMTHIDENGKVIRLQKDDLTIDAESFGDRLRQLFDFQIQGDDIIWVIFGLTRRDTLLRTDLIERYVSSDEILMSEILLHGKFYQVPEYLFFHRSHPESSYRKTKSPIFRLAWFDPEKKRKIELPIWYLFYKHLSYVRNAELKPSFKLRCYFEIVRRSFYLWKRFAGDFIKLGRMYTGYYNND